MVFEANAPGCAVTAATSAINVVITEMNTNTKLPDRCHHPVFRPSTASTADDRGEAGQRHAQSHEP